MFRGASKVFSKGEIPVLIAVKIGKNVINVMFLIIPNLTSLLERTCSKNAGQSLT